MGIGISQRMRDRTEKRLLPKRLAIANSKRCLLEGKAMLDIYTDGAAGANTPGGWAFVVVQRGKKVFEKSGSLENTTTSRAELTAIYQALKWCLKKKISAVVHSDSMYAVNALTNWMWIWSVTGWHVLTNIQQTFDKHEEGDDKHVKNREFFEKFLTLLQENPQKFNFVWVRGHSGNEWNEQADKLAKTARLEIKAALAERENEN